MKSLMLLWQRMLADASIQCRTSATRDLARVSSRVKHEGEEFLTLTLPEIGKAFERSLDQGQVTDALLSLCGSKGGFPVFLQDFLQLVFDRRGGSLLDNPSVEAIQAVRQLTLSFGKVLLPCSTAREEQAFAAFVKCEQELRDVKFTWSSQDLRDFERIGSVLFGDVFGKIDTSVYNGEIVPKHGPGATADKLRGNAKFRQHQWPERLESIFPSSENLIPNVRYIDSLDELQFLDPGSEMPVRVVSVPKTVKTPRIIAIEPTCMQYMQQGLMEKFVECMESDELISGMVGFTDQKPNQLMACESSSNGELATLDLSEASDRVSLKLVQSLLFNYGYLSEAVMATRSTRANVPGYGTLSLSKFASMGSALTFPIEECVFLTCIFYAIERELSERLTRKTVRSFVGKVRVYGDDLVVPIEFVPAVVETLETFGFKVNHNKSFWTGKFRESCGREYFDGHDVSIFRVRRLLPQHRTDAQEVLSAISLRNQAYWQGYWETADYLDTYLQRLVPLPNVLSSSPCHGRESVLGYSEERIHSDYQHPLVKGVVVRTRIPASKLEDEWALLKCLLKRGVEPYADVDHLERQGRPRVVGITLGWRCPY